jgi:membrane-bound serine protease (ClpP class)
MTTCTRTMALLGKKFWLSLLLIGLVLSFRAEVAATEGGGFALLLHVKGPIGPATSDYVLSGIQQAESDGARLVILQMDTPGGLDTSMREIVQGIIESRVPIAVYVAPGGARAASAGTYILYAAHVAAMAPGTNLGAATPVNILGGGEAPPDGGEKGKEGKTAKPAAGGGSAMQRKMINDAVAYIRSLAQLRGRNAEWAEQAVRGAASLPANEALQKGVIDFVASNVPQLLAKANGRKVTVNGEPMVLQTKDLAVKVVEPDWRSRVLSVITDPNIAYVLMLIGIYGLIFEFSNPGYILPGVVGAICLVLALYAFHVLPVNYAGMGLMLLGIAFMVAEAFVPSFGALGIGGVIAFVVGSVILMNTESQFYTISRPLIMAFALTSAAFFIGLVGMVIRARQRPAVIGRESLIGDVGEAVEDFQGRGHIRAQGEIWQAVCDRPLRQGQKVRVTALDGLTVRVAPLDKED